LIRLLYTGDWHIRGTNPRNRLDDYKTALKEKLREIFELAKKWEAKAIIAPGDIFDRPEVTISVLLEFVMVLREAPVTIYTTPGNHDLYGYNVETFHRSSLKLLEMLVPKLQVITDPTEVVTFDGSTALSFTPYSGKMDLNGYGYSPEYEGLGDMYKIHVAHGMLLDHTPPFDKFTYIQDVQTRADMVLTGHDHTGYGVYNRKDGKVFCNPGALTRLAASVKEMQRQVQVGLITVDGKESKVELIALKTAKPGEEVLDRSRIEAEKERQYAMDTFSALMKAKTGDAVLMDVNQIVETIAKQQETAPHIVKAAIELIDEQRAAL
jgi:exonuclease SbcD